MQTCCPACRSKIFSRFHVNRPKDPTLWIETYQCGSVYQWGALRKNETAASQCLRQCVEPGEDAG